MRKSHRDITPDQRNLGIAVPPSPGKKGGFLVQTEAKTRDLTNKWQNNLLKQKKPHPSGINCHDPRLNKHVVYQKKDEYNDHIHVMASPISKKGFGVGASGNDRFNMTAKSSISGVNGHHLEGESIHSSLRADGLHRAQPYRMGKDIEMSVEGGDRYDRFEQGEVEASSLEASLTDPNFSPVPLQELHGGVEARKPSQGSVYVQEIRQRDIAEANSDMSNMEISAKQKIRHEEYRPFRYNIESTRPALPNEARRQREEVATAPLTPPIILKSPFQTGHMVYNHSDNGDKIGPKPLSPSAVQQKLRRYKIGLSPQQKVRNMTEDLLPKVEMESYSPARSAGAPRGHSLTKEPYSQMTPGMLGTIYVTGGDGTGKNTKGAPTVHMSGRAGADRLLDSRKTGTNNSTNAANIDLDSLMKQLGPKYANSLIASDASFWDENFDGTEAELPEAVNALHGLNIDKNQIGQLSNEDYLYLAQMQNNGRNTEKGNDQVEGTFSVLHAGSATGTILDDSHSHVNIAREKGGAYLGRTLAENSMMLLAPSIVLDAGPQSFTARSTSTNYSEKSVDLEVRGIMKNSLSPPRGIDPSRSSILTSNQNADGQKNGYLLCPAGEADMATYKLEESGGSSTIYNTYTVDHSTIQYDTDSNFSRVDDGNDDRSRLSLPSVQSDNSGLVHKRYLSDDHKYKIEVGERKGFLEKKEGSTTKTRKNLAVAIGGIKKTLGLDRSKNRMSLGEIGGNQVESLQISQLPPCHACTKTGVLWCSGCAKIYCYNCWSLAGGNQHHAKDAAIVFAADQSLLQKKEKNNLGATAKEIAQARINKQESKRRDSILGNLPGARTPALGGLSPESSIDIDSNINILKSISTSEIDQTPFNNSVKDLRDSLTINLPHQNEGNNGSRVTEMRSIQMSVDDETNATFTKDNYGIINIEETGIADPDNQESRSLMHDILDEKEHVNTEGVAQISRLNPDIFYFKKVMSKTLHPSGKIQSRMHDRYIEYDEQGAIHFSLAKKDPERAVFLQNKYNEIIRVTSERTKGYGVQRKAQLAREDLTSKAIDERVQRKVPPGLDVRRGKGKRDSRSPDRLQAKEKTNNEINSARLMSEMNNEFGLDFGSSVQPFVQSINNYDNNNGNDKGHVITVPSKPGWATKEDPIIEFGGSPLNRPLNVPESNADGTSNRCPPDPREKKLKDKARAKRQMAENIEIVDSEDDEEDKDWGFSDMRARSADTGNFPRLPFIGPPYIFDMELEEHYETPLRPFSRDAGPVNAIVQRDGLIVHSGVGKQPLAGTARSGYYGKFNKYMHRTNADGNNLEIEKINQRTVRELAKPSGDMAERSLDNKEFENNFRKNEKKENVRKNNPYPDKYGPYGATAVWPTSSTVVATSSLASLSKLAESSGGSLIIEPIKVVEQQDKVLRRITSSLW